jgi:hypothetical protein
MAAVGKSARGGVVAVQSTLTSTSAGRGHLQFECEEEGAAGPHRQGLSRVASTVPTWARARPRLLATRTWSPIPNAVLVEQPADIGHVTIHPS